MTPEQLKSLRDAFPKENPTLRFVEGAMQRGTVNLSELHYSKVHNAMTLDEMRNNGSEYMHPIIANAIRMQEELRLLSLTDRVPHGLIAQHSLWSRFKRWLNKSSNGN